MPSGLMLPLPCPTIDGERPKRNSVIALVSCDNVPPLQLAPLTAQLDQAHFMMICSVRTHRQRQAMAIHYPFVAKFIGNIGQDLTQNFALEICAHRDHGNNAI